MHSVSVYEDNFICKILLELAVSQNIYIIS